MILFHLDGIVCITFLYVMGEEILMLWDICLYSDGNINIKHIIVYKSTKYVKVEATRRDASFRTIDLEIRFLEASS